MKPLCAPCFERAGSAIGVLETWEPHIEYRVRNCTDGYFAEDKPNPTSDVSERFRMGTFSFGAYRPLTSPDLLDVRVASERNAGDDETRTRDLCRDS